MKTLRTILITPGKPARVVLLPRDHSPDDIAALLNVAFIEPITRFINGTPYVLYADESAPLQPGIKYASAMLVSDRVPEVITGSLLITFYDTNSRLRSLTKRQISAITSPKNMIDVDAFIAAKGIVGDFFIDENTLLLPGGSFLLYDYPFL